MEKECPRCQSHQVIKSGFIGEKQRFKCKKCAYFFTVDKLGKQIDQYYIVKALQLYLEGISYREIERILGVSHVTVMNWVKRYKLQNPDPNIYKPTYKVLKHSELIELMQKKDFLKNAGMIITELGDKYMVIRWERFR